MKFLPVCGRTRLNQIGFESMELSRRAMGSRRKILIIQDSAIEKIGSKCVAANNRIFRNE